MSVSGISSSNAFSYQQLQSNSQNFKSEFQQLGRDLQSGKLSQAQSDFATLQSDAPSSAAPAPSTTLSFAFSKLSQDRHSGNLVSAQQDYTAIQQDFQQQSPAATSAHHHHHRGSGGSSDSASEALLDQLFSQLGQALQSGNLTTAQSAYASLQQDLAPFTNSSSSSVGSPSANTNSDSGAKTTNSLLSISI